MEMKTRSRGSETLAEPEAVRPRLRCRAGTVNFGIDEQLDTDETGAECFVSMMVSGHLELPLFLMKVQPKTELYSLYDMLK